MPASEQSAPPGQPHVYRAYGLLLQSDFPIPELGDPLGDDLPGISIAIRTSATPPPEPETWFSQSTTASDRVWLRSGRIAQGYVLQFPAYADFLVDEKGAAIACRARTGASPFTVRHLLLDQVLPLAMTLRGRHALHATAVRLPQGVCAFIGPSGIGKSTLAASFSFAGYPVVSDDCLVLYAEPAGVLAQPAYPGVRLWQDTYEALAPATADVRIGQVAEYTTKRRVLSTDEVAAWSSGPMPLIRIYALAHAKTPSEADVSAGGGRTADTIAIEPITGPQAFLTALSCAFTLDASHRGKALEQFRWLEGVTAHVPMRRLTLPLQYAALPAAVGAVFHDVGGRA